MGERNLAFHHLALYHLTAVEFQELPPYSFQESLTRTMSISTIFSPSFWPKEAGLATKVPVFIVGFMRSGSTLVEQMLHTIPGVVGLGEDRSCLFDHSCDEIFDEMISVLNSKLPSIRDEIIGSLSSGSIEVVMSTIYKHATAVQEEMVVRAEGLREEGEEDEELVHVVDKMLFNFRSIGFIHLLFPQATILHMVRDPMDTLWSCYKQKFDDPSLAFSHSPKV